MRTAEPTADSRSAAGCQHTFESAVIDGFFRRFLASDTQRSKKPTVIGRQIEAVAGGQEPGRSRNPSHSRSVVPAHEPDDRFERYSHIETRLARFRSACLDLSVFGDSGGNRVGQLFREPVHDVIHSCSSSSATGPGSGAYPNPNLH
jgi:hypothetical protein